MTKIFIVGLGYKARQGKNILAEKLMERLPGSRIYSFAAALKAYCRASGWMTVKDAPLLQMVGTDIMRRINPDIWVNCLKYQLEEEQPRVALITDMRFHNEFALCAAYGMTIKVSRLNEDGSLYISPDRPANHPSETDLDGAKFDYHVEAKSGDIKGLEHSAELIAARIRENLVLRGKHENDT
jgi:hypothetical protein